MIKYKRIPVTNKSQQFLKVDSGQIIGTKSNNCFKQINIEKNPNFEKQV